VWARRPRLLDEALARLKADAIDAIALSCDVGEEQSVDAAMSATLAAFGRLDILVANAGRSSSRPLVDAGLDEWNRVLATNLTGTFLTFRAAARAMIEAGRGGALLAISSLAATGGYPGMSSYCATKAGIGGLVRSAAVELAPYRVRCNALLPGFTVNSSFGPELVDERRGRAISAAIPARRWGTPDDVGRAAVYLADPTLHYHTGASVVVDGGLALMPPENAAHAVIT
jgi:NAD(P)-dependent dehydrogenase (short-subunit alcohol dehydrogenase family)